MQPGMGTDTNSASWWRVLIGRPGDPPATWDHKFATLDSQVARPRGPIGGRLRRHPSVAPPTSRHPCQPPRPSQSSERIARAALECLEPESDRHRGGRELAATCRSSRGWNTAGRSAARTSAQPGVVGQGGGRARRGLPYGSAAANAEIAARNAQPNAGKLHAMSSWVSW